MSDVSLGIIRNEGESWLDCAIRYAKPWGLDMEVLDEYDRNIKQGMSEADAALSACYEWDVCEVNPSLTPKTKEAQTDDRR